MKTLKYFFITISLSLFATFSITGQNEKNITSSNVYIAGTTNIGSWDCTNIESEGTIEIETVDDGQAINSLEITIPVKEFTDCTPPAGPSSGQESAVHKNLKAEEHPYITFKLTNTHPYPFHDEAYLYGELKVAGESRNIQAKVQFRNNGDTSIISGKKELSMKEFDIDPPTGLFGVIRSREEVDVEFEFTFE